MRSAHRRVPAGTSRGRLRIASYLLLMLGCLQATASVKEPKKTPAELRADYLNKVAATWQDAAPARSLGSLWSPAGVLNDPGLDYKARALHDNLTIVVSVQTTAAQSGSVNNSRDFSTSSALTGIFGKTPTATNPLLAAQSSSTLKGQGQTASNTTFSTGLTGEVIGVLPNGNLVVEAHRQIFMNNQHEDLVVRGVARTGDISPANTIASTSLSSLEIELKGKGIISDSVRPPNPITRALLWVFGF